MYTLYAQNAGTWLPGTPRVLATGPDRAALEDLARAKRAVDDAEFRYSMAYWVERA